MPGDAILEEIIIDGTSAQEQTFTQQEAKAYAKDEEEGDDAGWEEDVSTHAEAPEEVVPPVADPKGKKKKAVTAAGAGSKKKAGGRGQKWPTPRSRTSLDSNGDVMPAGMRAPFFEH